MKLILTVEDVPLSGNGKRVTIVDGVAKEIHAHSTSSDDAEYQLLAQAIARFNRVLTLETEAREKANAETVRKNR